MPTYEIVSRFYANDAWREGRKPVYGTYEQAAREASSIARELDRSYGNTHFWTVDLISPETKGSFFQLFHGRTA